MRLNPDCIRDILLMVENNAGYNTPVEYTKEKMDELHLLKYNHDEIMYHINQCSQAELITGVHFINDDFVMISDLTPKGHEFIANIRQDNVWNGVKSIAKKVGSTSLSALINISSNVITELIKAQFGIGNINPIF